MESTLFEIRLVGEGLKPGQIRSKELAEVIEVVEDMIASIVVHENPELKKENIIIGLAEIGNSSIGLRFAPNLEELTIPATHRLTQSVNNGDFSHLPSSVVNGLRKISSFTRKHECDAEFRSINGEITVLAVVTPKTEIPIPTPLVGETTIYGTITRSGGAEPKVQFRTIDGELIHCKASEELARKAGARLYTEVALNGLASWNAVSYEIESFEIESIGDYKSTPLPVAFAEIRRIVGSVFDDIEDVAQYVAGLRYGDVEG